MESFILFLASADLEKQPMMADIIMGAVPCQTSLLSASLCLLPRQSASSSARTLSPDPVVIPQRWCYWMWWWEGVFSFRTRIHNTKGYMWIGVTDRVTQKERDWAQHECSIQYDCSYGMCGCVVMGGCVRTGSEDCAAWCLLSSSTSMLITPIPHYHLLCHWWLVLMWGWWHGVKGWNGVVRSEEVRGDLHSIRKGTQSKQPKQTESAQSHPPPA